MNMVPANEFIVIGTRSNEEVCVRDEYKVNKLPGDDVKALQGGKPTKPVQPVHEAQILCEYTQLESALDVTAG
jgi:hypothetical protein